LEHRSVGVRRPIAGLGQLLPLGHYRRAALGEAIMGGVRLLGGSMPLGGGWAFRRIVFGIVIAMLAVPVLSGWKVTGTKVSYAYYPVSGRSHAEIVSSVRRYAPRAGRAYGIGFIDFHPDYDMAAKNGECRVTRAETGLAIQLKLPEWKGPKDAPRSAARLGRHFEKSIRSHELQHVKIAERYARRISRDLLGLKPEKDCWALRRAAYDLIKRIKREHIGSQKAFDRRTFKQIKRLL
jgi:predicted secreted Zn-dependent protease